MHSKYVHPPAGKEQLRQRLYLAARVEVKSVITALPPPLRTHATNIPVLFEMKPRPSEIKSGIEPDTLGLFSGESMADSHSSNTVTPTEIIIFMENVWDYSRRDSPTFREEIRRTYLHELGHYLGLDEMDLIERDVD
jgi:predicted Zn-dependent protease with MMP-like domain